MSAQDALWLTMDRPNNLMVIDVAVVLDGVPSVDALRSAFETLLSRHPVFGRRAVRRGNSWWWIDDREFDVARHVCAVPMPPDTAMQDVERHVAARRSVPFDRAHPLWSAELLAPVQLDDGTTGSVIVTRFHHAIADGVRLTQVMLGMLDPDFASSVPKVARSGTSGGALLSTDAIGASAAEVARVTGAATRSAAGIVAGAARGAVSTVGQVVDLAAGGSRVSGLDARVDDRARAPPGPARRRPPGARGRRPPQRQRHDVGRQAAPGRHVAHRVDGPAGRR